MKYRVLIFSIIFLTSSTAAFSFNTDKGKGAIIELSGTVQSSSSGGLYSTGGITPGEVRSLNEKVEKEGYDAVIYDINSGGGAVVASKEVMREIESLDATKICRFRDVAASGAYLFSLGCDMIVADSATLTGSIGVTSSYLEFSEAMNKYGVDYVNISSGEYKEVGSQYQNITPDEREILQEKSDKIHQQFLDLVKENRNITQSEHRNISTGVIYLGSEAEEIGLVDELGGREKAKEIAENVTGKDLTFSRITRQQSFDITSFLASFNPGNFLDFNQLPLTATLR